jgi:activator of HSP90 ATPase
MSDEIDSGACFSATTRRQMIVAVAGGLGGLVALPKLWGKNQSVEEKSDTSANHSRTFLHQEVDFDAPPHRIYKALLDAKQFATLTGMSAEIDPKVGGAFSTFGGLIVGRNIELISNQRIVQAWRPADWEAGVYSVVKFDLKVHDSRTKIVLDHTGFPEGKFNSLDYGWKPRYWDPMKKFLAS